MLKPSLSNAMAILALAAVTMFALIVACETASPPGQKSIPTELPLPNTGDLTPSQLATAAAKSGVTQAKFATRVTQQGIQMSEVATAVFSPSMTPHPTDFVKEGNPTAQERGIQALTPFPSTHSAASQRVEQTQLSSPSAAGPSQELLDTFRRALSGSIAENHDPSYDYSAPVVVARVRPGEPYGRFTHPYTGKTNWRQPLEVLESYYNSLPGTVDIMVSVPESRLDAGKEYIVILNKSVVQEPDAPSDTDPYTEINKQYAEYTEEELEIMGGEAYFYWPPLLIGNSGAWYEVPFSHLFSSVPSAGIATPTPHSTQLAAALAELAGDTSRYDAVTRVRVLSYADHMVPLDSIEWPEEAHKAPVHEKILRASLRTVEIYHGALPADFEVVNDFHYMGATSQTLDSEREYVLFLYKRSLLQGEHPDDELRNHLNQQQLDAIGGEGYVYFVTQAWIIDGETAWRVPRKHISYLGTDPVGDHLAGAKSGGVSMDVSALKSTIVTAASD